MFPLTLQTDFVGQYQIPEQYNCVNASRQWNTAVTFNNLGATS